MSEPLLPGVAVVSTPTPTPPRPVPNTSHVVLIEDMRIEMLDHHMSWSGVAGSAPQAQRRLRINLGLISEGFSVFFFFFFFLAHGGLGGGRLQLSLPGAAPQSRPEPEPDPDAPVRESADIPRRELVAMVGKLRDVLCDFAEDPNHTDWEELEAAMVATGFNVSPEDAPKG